MGIRKYPEFELHFDDKAALRQAVADFTPIRDFGDLRDVLKVAVKGDVPSRIVALQTLNSLHYHFDAQEEGWIPLFMDAAQSENFYVMKAALDLLITEAPTDEVLEVMEPVLENWMANDNEGISRVTKARKQTLEGAVRRANKEAGRKERNQD